MIALGLLPTLLPPAPLPVLPGDTTRFAHALALTGDLDGDKTSELAVGSPSDGPDRVGRVYLFRGKDGTVLRRLDGPAADSGYGTAVDVLGDLDEDGVPDLAVGAPYLRDNTPGAPKPAEGRVDLLSGATGTLLRSLLPEAGERYLGTDLAALGDVDGDGKPDLLVRAHFGAGPEERERFLVASGATGARLLTIESPAGVTSHHVGRPLAAIPDVDGDGRRDVAVEYGSDVHVVSTKDGHELAKVVSPLPPTAKSSFGFSICGIPGDPVKLAVGDTFEEGFGSVRVIPIVLGSGDEARRQAELATYLLGDADFPGAGCSLALAGDLDADGVPDLVAGFSDGRGGGLMVLSSGTLEAARAVEGEPEDSGRTPIGWRVAAGADVDGDGSTDIAVARAWPTALDAAVRGVVIFSGRDGQRIREIGPPPEEPAGASEPPRAK